VVSFAVLRSVVAGDRSVRVGDSAVRRGRELGSLRVGVVGFGRIGQAFARRLTGFGTAVIAHDPHLNDDDISSMGAQPASLEELAERCDAVSLHAPGGRRVVDDAWLARTRNGSVVVNTARADLVDEHPVAVALRSGRLGGYAADTLTTETSGAGSPLLADDLADLVVITPHIAAQTVEAVDRMGSAAAAAVLAVLSGAPPAHTVELRRNSESDSGS
jgi:D-3-phosphoglycerate dehydrogenase